MNIKQILFRNRCGAELSHAELAYMLELTDPAERDALFREARRIRQQNFGPEVFLYGFVYFSTYCRNGCRFCGFRSQNRQSIRYRRSREEILEAAVRLKDSGVNLLDLTMGEDPYYLNDGERGYEQLLELIRAVREETGLPLMVSPGIVPERLLPYLREAGADWYALYQETHTPALYDRLRLDQPYQERWERKLSARRYGLLVEEGLLTGVGDTTADQIHSLRQMELLGARQVRTMTFVPQKGTPLENVQAGSCRRELNLIAVMRLLFPDRLIPASLDVEGLQGLKSRLDAGANVVTSLIPPDAGLAGVAQSEKDIGDGARTVQGIQPVLARCGLRAASPKQYAQWLDVAHRQDCRNERKRVSV